jgi:hypothetical protein
MLRQLFFVRNNNDGDGDGEVREVTDHRENKFLITGPSNTGKTSFLCALACEHASLHGKYSLIFTRKQNYEEQFPLSVNLSQQTTPQHHRESFRYLQLSYNNSTNDLIRNISSLQFYTHLPAIVIIDDLSLIIDPTLTISRSSIEFLDQACRVLGHVFDAMESFGCKDLIISDTCESSEYLNLLQQFFKRQILLRFERKIPDLRHQSEGFTPPSVEIFVKCGSRSLLIGKSTHVGEGLEIVESVAS